jgi:hypothetical protein
MRERDDKPRTLPIELVLAFNTCRYFNADTSGSASSLFS